jgi:FkbH-like protein
MSPLTPGASGKNWREEADRSIAAGQPERAAAALAQVRNAEAESPAAAAFLVSRYERIRGSLALQPHRLAILRSFTVEPVVPLLRAAAFAAGLDLTVHVGEFNAYVQEILDGESALYRFQADTVILAVESRDVAPHLWGEWADLSESAAREATRAVVDRFHSWIVTFRRHSQANLVIHSLTPPEFPARGILDSQLEPGQTEAFAEINRELRRMAREQRGVYILDYDALVARSGRIGWRDERKWLTVRMAFPAAHLADVSREWMRFLHPLSGRVAKAIAVDLDNTLWGGVVGEDGFDGIQLGAEFPGAAYRNVQRALLDLRQRGILLAICSKNNSADAMEVLERHPDMLLRPQHFAALRIDWNDKAANLREIAEELNIGIDAVAFLDDNPVERQQVRGAVPEATVIELPEDPFLFARALHEAPVFERLTLSAEDLRRGEMYQAQAERRKVESGAASREDFYRSLEQEAEIGRVSAATLARVAQLTQKTNQFNLTTRRYTEEQIARMAESPDWRVHWIRVRDHFSDNGLVGVAILHRQESAWEIDTFLLSCRVIGRTVETAFLAYLIETAEAEGGKTVEGWFLPTKKNSPACEFYSSHGFRVAEGPVEAKQGGTRWVLDLPQQAVRRPEWIRLKLAPEDK